MNDTAMSFSTLDLIILGLTIVAAAFFVESSEREFQDVHRWGATAMYSGGPSPLIPPKPLDGVEAHASRAVQHAVAVLLAASPGLALVAFRPGRGTRPGRRGPGHVALAIAGGLTALGHLNYAWFTHGPTRWTGFIPVVTRSGSYVYWFYVAMPGGRIAYAILSGWIYLALVGGRGSPRLPLERTGRWIGLAWIATSVAA